MKSLLLAFAICIWAAVPAWAQSYRIQPGDTLAVSVLEDPALDRLLLVLPDGSITLPLAGTVRASGLTVDQLETRLASELSGNFADRPNVFVSVSSLALESEALTIDIFVVGEVLAPGVITVKRGTNLLQAIAAAGGPSRFAATRRIQLRRVDPATGRDAVGTFDYRAVLRGAQITGLVPLRDGDVIVVPERRLFER